MSNGERGSCKTCLNQRSCRHLMVQCASPIVQPPNAHVEKGQALLALETGRFYYWGIKGSDDDHDGVDDHFEFCWKEVQCGEGLPIAYRQSQIFFYDNFDGTQQVRGPPISTEEGGKRAVPKRGDYVIDNVQHSLWLMNIENQWILQTREFGTVDSAEETLTIEKSSNTPNFNNTSNRFEVYFYVTICNHQGEESAEFDVIDDARQRAIDAGLGPEVSIDFNSPPTDLTFANSEFAGSGSLQTNVLVSGKKIAANSCQTIRYLVSAETWQPSSSTVTIENTATLTERTRDVSSRSVSAKSVVELLASSFPGHVLFTMRFGPQMNESLTSTRSSVKICACNIGPTPLKMLSITLDINAALNGGLFSVVGTPIAQWNIGFGALPTINSTYDGKNDIYLAKDTFCLCSGQSFEIDFDLLLGISALHDMHNRIEAKSHFLFTDVWNTARSCCAPETFSYNPSIVTDSESLTNDSLLESHIIDETIHRTINDSGTGTTDLWSASKLLTLFDSKCALSHVHNASDITSGVLNDNRIAASSIVQHVASLPHQSLQGAGGKSHAEIDAHILDQSIHVQIDDSLNTAENLWSASKISALLQTKSSSTHNHDASAIVSGTFQDARISAQNVLQHNSALLHSSLVGVGQHTHAELDDHVANLSIHREINDAGSSVTDLWSAANIQTKLLARAALSHAHSASEITSGTFDDTRITASNVTQHNAALGHQLLIGAGQKTHEELDAHCVNDSIHRQINDSGTSATDLWSAAHINGLLLAKSAVGHTHDASHVASGSFADARIAASNIVQHNNALAHNLLIGAGQKTHDEIDDHVADLSIHRKINDAGTGATDLWSASHVSAQLLTKSAIGHIHAASEITSGSFADARIAASNVLQYNANLLHQYLSGAGSKTHDEIDDHVNDLSIHRRINDAGSGATDLWSASQIITQLLTKSATSHIHAANEITSGTFADARIAASNIVQHNAALSHNLLLDVGVKTHAELDSHLTDLSIHRSINDAGTATTDLWSASKIITQLLTKAATSHVHAAADVTSGAFADARISASSVVQHTSQISHDLLSGVGIKTHPELDSHVLDSTIHRVINDSGNSVTDLWSASKRNTMLLGKSAVGHSHVVADLSDFATSVDARLTLQKGNANGLATLDSSGKILASQLSLSNLDYKGTWNALINSPPLVAGVGTKGNYYVVNVAGTTLIDGISDWQLNDWIIFNGTVWEKADHSDQVQSVAGKQGNVTLVAANIADFSAAVSSNVSLSVNTAAAHIANTSNPHNVTKSQVGLGNVLNIKDNITATVAPTSSDDSLSGYSAGSLWTNALSGKSYVCVSPLVTLAVWRQIGIESHTDLTNIGTNTHAQIDTHIADATKHRQINDNGTATTDLWSASQISMQLATKSASGHSHTTSDVTSGTFADARISQSSVTQYNSALAHQTLSGAGSNTHAQIDTHIADSTKHRTINDSGSATTDLWSASKISTSLAGKSNTGHSHVASDVTDFSTQVDSRISALKTVAQYNANSLQGVTVSIIPPTSTSDVLTYSGSSWQPRRIADASTQSYFIDDFMAATSSLTTNYLTSLLGLGSALSVIDAVGGCVQLDTGSLLNTSAQIYLKNSIYRADYETSFKCRFRILQLTQIVFRVGMESSDGNNCVELYYDVTSSAGSWSCRSMSNNVATTASSGISADTSFHVVEFQTKSSQITFYIDGNLVSTITTNIPTSLMRLNCTVSAKTSSQRSAQLDFWSTLSDRSASQGVNSSCLLL